MELSETAVPRADGSDTAVLKLMAGDRWGWPALYDGPRHILGVHVEPGPPVRNDGLTNAPDDHPGLFQVEVALRRWPAAEALARLVDHFTPLLMGPGYGRGCVSGHTHPAYAGGAVSIFASVDDAVGGAEGFVHEVAHQRLHCMGVDLERHDGRLIAPALDRVEGQWRYPEHVWFSPIRRDVPRPSTALLHGVYAWTFMLEVDLAACGVDAGEEYLARNAPKVRMGLDSLERVAWTAEGEKFLEALLGWGRGLVGRAEVALAEAGVTEVPVPPKEW